MDLNMLSATPLAPAPPPSKLQQMISSIRVEPVEQVKEPEPRVKDIDTRVEDARNPEARAAQATPDSPQADNYGIDSPEEAVKQTMTESVIRAELAEESKERVIVTEVTEATQTTNETAARTDIAAERPTVQPIAVPESSDEKARRETIATDKAEEAYAETRAIEESSQLVAA